MGACTSLVAVIECFLQGCMQGKLLPPKSRRTSTPSAIHGKVPNLNYRSSDSTWFVWRGRIALQLNILHPSGDCFRLDRNFVLCYSLNF
jgi:hypothetical protein